MRILCWHMILLNYHILLLSKIKKMLQNLSSAAVVIGALRDILEEDPDQSILEH